MASSYRVYFSVVALALVATFSIPLAQTPQPGVPLVAFPKFRHVDAGAAAPADAINTTIKLLADNDFAPYSFKNADGAMVGISVDIASAACAEMRLKCKIVYLPFAELLPALIKGEGDAVITGVRITPSILQHASMTRPYFFSFGRFVTRLGTSFATPDVRTLAGRRLGVMKGSSHQAFLQKYFDRSALTGFDSETAMFEAVRTGAVDAVFTDAVRASFWIKGSASKACCTTLGAGFVDRSTFSRGLSVLVNDTKQNLRETFDFALDRLEEKEISSKILARYLSDSPF